MSGFTGLGEIWSSGNALDNDWLQIESYLFSVLLLNLTKENPTLDSRVVSHAILDPSRTRQLACSKVFSLAVSKVGGNMVAIREHTSWRRTFARRRQGIRPRVGLAAGNLFEDIAMIVHSYRPSQRDASLSLCSSHRVQTVVFVIDPSSSVLAVSFSAS